MSKTNTAAYIGDQQRLAGELEALIEQRNRLANAGAGCKAVAAFLEAEQASKESAGG